MRCSRCGKKAAEVVAVARPRPRGVAAISPGGRPSYKADRISCRFRSYSSFVIRPDLYKLSSCVSLSVAVTVGACALIAGGLPVTLAAIGVMAGDTVGVGVGLAATVGDGALRTAGGAVERVAVSAIPAL
jgi:hypothetical protein